MNQKDSYEDWLESVDETLWGILQCELDDFELDYENLYKQGYSPARVASYAIEED